MKKNDDDIKRYWKKAYEFVDEIKNWPQWKKEIRVTSYSKTISERENENTKKNKFK